MYFVASCGRAKSPLPCVYESNADAPRTRNKIFVCVLCGLHKNSYLQSCLRRFLSCWARYMLTQFRLSVCLSVCHTSGSVKSGWSYDHAIFTIQWPHRLLRVYCGISFIQKFWRDLPPSRGVKQGWGWETSYFRALCVSISKTAEFLLMTNRKFHMGFRLASKSMTLDNHELDGGRPPLF